MKVNCNQLFKKMLVCPRLTLKCDDEKIRCGYVYNDYFKGWVLENKPFKGTLTKDVAEYIFQTYKDVEIVWSRTA